MRPAEAPERLTNVLDALSFLAATVSERLSKAGHLATFAVREGAK